MKKVNSLKKAFALSVLATLTCLCLLIGSTFAWFTSTVSSNGNKIVAGSLEVDLLMYDGTSYVSIADEDGAIFGPGSIFAGNQTVWEPGKTQIAFLAVKNNGSLALKYNIAIDVEDNGLVGALKYALLDEAKNTDLTSATSWADIVTAASGAVGDVEEGRTTAAPNGKLVSEGDTDYFALAIHMNEEAGNEYQGKDITIDVKVVAAQVSSEEDAFGSDYDSLSTTGDWVIESSGQWHKRFISSEKLEGTDTDYITVLDSDYQPVSIKTIASGSVGVATLTVSGHNISYVNTTGTAQTVVIRTSDAADTITVNAPKDVVYHYGTTGNVEILKVASSSYHEEGVANYIENGSGRLVIGKGGDVETVVLYDNYTASSSPVATVQNHGGSVEHVYATTNAVANANNENSGDNVQLKVLYYKEAVNPGNVLTTGSATQTDIEKAVNEEKYTASPDATVESLKADTNNYVCHINGTGYATLSAALSAGDQKVIYLLKDNAESGLKVAASKTVTINLNGFDLTASNWAINEWTDGSLVFTGNGDVSSFRISSNGANITFDENYVGTISSITYVKGNLVIKGGTYANNISITDGASYKPNTYTLSKFIPPTYTTEAVDADHVTVVPVTAVNGGFSVTIDEITNYYMTFSNALDAAKAGGTIKLLKDISGGSGNYYPTGTVTLDLNGHTWDCSSSYPGIYLYSGSMIVKSSVDGGKVLGNGTNKIFDVRNETTSITFESGDFSTAYLSIDCNATFSGGTYGKVYLCSNCSTATITGGTFNDNFTTTYNSTTVVNITGGTFNEQVCCNQSATGVFNISGGTFKGYVGNGGTFNISGGTFYKDVNAGASFATNSNTSFNVSGGTFEEDITANARVTIATGYHWDSTTMSVVAD